MLIHQLKQIFRGLWRYKSFTVINFLGLSIGIAAIITLFLIATYEKQFDRLHSDTSRLFRVVSKKDRNGKQLQEATVPYPMAAYFRNEMPGIPATEIHFDKDRTVRIGAGSPFEEKNLVFADSLFFRVMDFSQIKDFWIRGNPQQALNAPNQAVVTRETALRYFGNEDAIGKTFRLDNKADIEVVGIVQNIPANTHLPVNMVISYSTLTPEFMAGLSMDNWSFTGNGYCYVKLPETITVQQAELALAQVVKKHAEDENDKKQKFSLQPFSEIHFDPTFDESNPGYTVSHKYLDMLLLLGLFIILIACINYINLSTSLAFTKSKEVGIRKTIGASRKQLFGFYFSETVLVTTIAFIIGLSIAILCLPLINRMLDKSITGSLLMNASFVVYAFFFILTVSLISGAYPALILSGFTPVLSLKSQFTLPGKSSTLLRKALVVFQFTTSIALIICTIVIARQVGFFTKKSLGFNKDAVVEVGLPDSDSARIESLRAQLQNQSGIHSFTFCLGAPISGNGINTSMKAPELPEKQEFNIKVIPCDINYMNTYGIQLAAGRWLLPGEEKNLGSALLVNETTVKTLGYRTASEAIGKKIGIGINEMNPVIVGVVKDFHTSSLHRQISNVCLLPFPPFYYATGIRLQPGNTRNAMAVIEKAFRKVYPNDVYEYHFIDDTLASLYEQENRDYQLFKVFSAISIFICCIGLWGLIAFVVVRKTKEIGIRKVLGASISSIVALLSKDFLMLVLVALVVACPVAWYFMHKWLENFAYRVSISWWVFVLAGVFAVVIAVLTISFQTVRAALANPVKNLRTE